MCHCGSRILYRKGLQVAILLGLRGNYIPIALYLILRHHHNKEREYDGNLGANPPKVSPLLLQPHKASPWRYGTCGFVGLRVSSTWVAK